MGDEGAEETGVIGPLVKTVRWEFDVVGRSSVVSDGLAAEAEGRRRGELGGQSATMRIGEIE